MNNKQPTLCLIFNEVNQLYEISKQKAIRVREQTQYIYDKLMEQSNNNEKSLIEKYDDFLLHGMKKKFMGIERKRQETMRKKLWQQGWQVRDPYFLWNFKALYPIIKRDFFDKEVTTYMVRKQYSKMAMNQSFQERYGNSVHEFIRVFNAEGGQYIKDLHRTGIQQKMMGNFETYNPNWRGLPNSIVIDLLGAMRTMTK